LFPEFEEENGMPQALDLLRSGGAQTLRLTADLAAPLVVGTRRLRGRIGGRLGPGLTRAWSWSRDGAGRAGRVLPLILLGLGLGVGTGVMLLYLNATPPVQANAPAATEPLRAGPVKIVDAAPRGGNCEEQVWPYIEQRCLKRAPTAAAVEPPAPQAAPAAPDLAADAPAASIPPAAATETVALAPAPPDEDVDANGVPMQRLASLPQTSDNGTAALAGAAAGVATWQLVERRAERRRSGRRGGYSRRQAMPFGAFGFRF
jgi:hypothetical protein